MAELGRVVVLLEVTGMLFRLLLLGDSSNKCIPLPSSSQALSLFLRHTSTTLLLGTVTFGTAEAALCGADGRGKAWRQGSGEAASHGERVTGRGSDGCRDSEPTRERRFLEHVESGLDSSLGSVHVKGIVFVEVINALGALDGARAHTSEGVRLGLETNRVGAHDGSSGPGRDRTVERHGRGGQILLVERSKGYIEEKRQDVEFDFGIARGNRFGDHAASPDG